MQLLQLVVGDAQLIQQGLCQRGGVFNAGAARRAGAALDNGGAEESPGALHGDEVVDLTATAGLAHDGNLGRVAAEGGDVVPDPLQRQHAVEHTGHAGLGILLVEGAQMQRAEDIQPVVDAHHDEILLPHPRVRAQHQRAGAGGEAAAVEID